MDPVLAFVVVMAVWTVSEFVAKKTRSLLSSLFVASIIFLVGFLTGIFPDDLLASSSLLALAGVVVGFIIVHLGTMISLDDFKKQWKTFLVGLSTVLGIGIALWVASLLFGRRITGSAADGYAQALDFVVAGTGALSGGTISVIIVQEAALGVGLTSIAVFPVLIAALQGLVGFPLTSLILRQEAGRLRDEFRAGSLAPAEVPDEEVASSSTLPYTLSRWMLRRVNRMDGKPAVFYFHPWELDPAQPRQRGIGPATRFRHYVNLHRTESRLHALLRDFAWDRMDRIYMEGPADAH